MAQPPDDHTARHAALQLIDEIRALILAAPAMPLVDLEALQDRVRPLVVSADPVVADAAGRLELRLLGAILTAHGMAMRAMSEQVRRLAHWLPPDSPHNN